MYFWLGGRLLPSSSGMAAKLKIKEELLFWFTYFFPLDSRVALHDSQFELILIAYSWSNSQVHLLSDTSFSPLTILGIATLIDIIQISQSFWLTGIACVYTYYLKLMIWESSIVTVYV